MNVDYIIVGLGLAGIAIAEELSKNNKSFVVFENNSQNSSLVAGGMYNPVVLKRFTPVWNAEEQLKTALPFYKNLEKKFNKTYHHKIDIYRIFKSIEEQNNWFSACDNILLEKFMISDVIQNNNQYIIAPFGYGKLTNTGRIDTNLLVKDYVNLLQNQKQIRFEEFEHKFIEFSDLTVQYKDIESKHIVFCEGFGLKENPFFNYLPMREAKGELITIRAPKLKVSYLIKAAVFVLPLGNDLYRVGATFNWTDKTKKPTEAGKAELLKKLNTFIVTEFEVIEQIAGIRPTVKDRRPLVGVHKKFKQLNILNGLGTRGVMVAPTMAKKLYNHIEFDIPLEKEISIERFD